jgi:branched-chain amino acid transport system permease protein
MPLLLAWIVAYCIMSVSWSFFSGKTGYISLATGAFYGLGMYIQALLGRDLPLGVNVLIAAVASFGLALGIGVVTLRLRGVYFTIFTFGLALFLNKFVHWYETAFLRVKGHMVKSADNMTILMFMLIIFGVVMFAVILLNKSRFGLALVCIGQNEDSAQHVGVNTTFTKVFAFAISAAPVGAVGAVMSTKAGYIDPDMAFSLLASFFPVLMAIFGGMQSLYGPVIGAVVFYSLRNTLMIEMPSQNMIVFGIIMVVVVLAMPRGLFGIVDLLIARRRRNFDGEVIGDA